MRDLRQLLIHRHKLVESGPGEERVAASGDESRDAEEAQVVERRPDRRHCANLPLEGWAACRREDLLGLRAMLDMQIGKLDEAAQRAAAERTGRGC